MTERILVIKLGALGDLVLCMSAFAAIRAEHPDAQIALLTGPPFAAFGLMMPWFDKVFLDPRPKVTEPLKWFKLIRDMRSFAPTRVYDFQGKTRQTILYHALGKPAWSGAAKGCSFPRPWPPAAGTHYTAFLDAQLESAGVALGVAPDLAWLDAPLDDLKVPEKFALLIMGCSPQHPHKRWPAAHFAELSRALNGKGLTCLAVGTKADSDSIAQVRSLAPAIVDLCGKTSLKQLAALARQAQIVVGNDTGPTHLAAAVGANTIALMSDKVDPLWSSPRGPHAQWLGGKPMIDLSVDEVLSRI